MNTEFSWKLHKKLLTMAASGEKNMVTGRPEGKGELVFIIYTCVPFIFGALQIYIHIKVH